MSYVCDVCGEAKASDAVATVSRHNGAAPVWWCVACLTKGKALVRGVLPPPAPKPSSVSTRPEKCGQCTMLGRHPGAVGDLACFHGHAPTKLVHGIRVHPSVKAYEPPPSWCPKPLPAEPSRKIDLKGA